VHPLPAVIDIHSHLLHSLDDGAHSFDVSLDMARMALKSGTTDIVATSHANTEYNYDPDLISARIQELQGAAGDGIRIHRGCDFHLSAQNIQWALREPGRFSINGLHYLLVEFPEVSLFHGIEEIFSSLRSVGLTPIVTHTERNPHLASDIPQLRRWVDNGIPLQITARSRLSEFGREMVQWCLRVLKEGLVHFVANDAHDLVHRPPKLDKAWSFLAGQFGEQYAEFLLELHLRAVIEGQPMEVRSFPPAPEETTAVAPLWHFGT
jgi:protein-tyrosine phosphatase